MAYVITVTSATSDIVNLFTQLVNWVNTYWQQGITLSLNAPGLGGNPSPGQLGLTFSLNGGQVSNQVPVLTKVAQGIPGFIPTQPTVVQTGTTPPFMITVTATSDITALFQALVAFVLANYAQGITEEIDSPGLGSNPPAGQFGLSFTVNGGVVRPQDLAFTNKALGIPPNQTPVAPVITTTGP